MTVDFLQKTKYKKKECSNSLKVSKEKNLLI